MFKQFKLMTTLWAFIGISGMLLASPAQCHSGIWVNSGGLSACGAKAYDLLTHAEDEGLSSGDFTYGIQAADRARRGQISYAEADRQMNDAMIRYIDQIRHGRFNPRSADHRIVMQPERVSAANVIAQGSASGGCDWLDQQAPPFEGYRQLKPLLKKYRAIAAQGPWPMLPTNMNVAPYGSNENLGTVRDMLVRLGYLSDSDSGSSSDSDDALMNAVKKFQSTHGLLPDGALGPATVKELNKSPAERVRQIVITMERWRWMPRNPGARYIRVNIAGFMLDAVENGRIVMSSPIIVGTDYRETPVFSATMTEVKFNPSWHVPHSLAIKDKLPKLHQEGASYLTNNHFVVTTTVNGKEREVNPHSINWKNVHEGNFHYSLRQTPGDYNALGRIRFTIISPFGVYLHSTPDQHLFEWPIRTFSSGCIRVKKVEELGAFVMNNSSDWPASRIASEMHGSSTKAVSLPRSIPVHVVYFTVWNDENGEPHFQPDVYGQDAHVASVMRRWL